MGLFDSGWGHQKIGRVLEWKTIKKGEYLYALVPKQPNATKNGYVLEHRVVMEKYLGRYLTTDEVVHHIDEDKHNNNIENLRLMSRTEHGKHHKKPLKLEQRTCPVCNTEFLRRPKGKYDDGRIPCCSRQCNGKRSRQIQLGIL